MSSSAYILFLSLEYINNTHIVKKSKISLYPKLGKTEKVYIFDYNYVCYYMQICDCLSLHTCTVGNSEF